MGACCSNPKYPCQIRCCCCCRTVPCTISCLKRCLPAGPYSVLRCDLCAHGPKLSDGEVQAVCSFDEKSIQNVVECRNASTQDFTKVIVEEPKEKIEIMEPKYRAPPSPVRVDASCNTDPPRKESSPLQPDSSSMTSFTKDSSSEQDPLDLIDGYANKSCKSLREALANFHGQIPDLDLSAKIDEALQKCNHPNDDKLTKDEAAAIYIRSMRWPGTTVDQLLEKAWEKADRSAMEPWFKYLDLLIRALKKLPDVKGEVWQGIEFDAKCQEKMKKKPAKLFTSMGFGTTSMAALKRHLRKSGKEKKIILIGYQGVKAKDITEYIENSDEPTTCLLPGMKMNTVELDLNEDQGLCIYHLSSTEPAAPAEDPFPSPIPRKDTHFNCPNRTCANICVGTHHHSHCSGFAHLTHACRHHCGHGYRCYRCKKHNEKLYQCSACNWRFCKECCFH